MTKPTTGTRQEWLAARLELLKAEKELTRRGDELTQRTLEFLRQHAARRELCMTASDVSELAARLARLERYHRSLRRLGWAALCFLPVGLGAFASGSGPVVRAEQVELITANGVRQATLDADSAGVTLTLFTAKGRPASALRLSDSTLTLLDANGRPVATLGGPRVRHLD